MGPSYQQPQSMAPGQVPMPQQPGQLPTHSQPSSAPSTSYPMQPASEPASQAAQLNADPHQLSVGDFPSLGIDGSTVDLPADLGIAQSLPFSGSEMNLAGMVRGAHSRCNDRPGAFFERP